MQNVNDMAPVFEPDGQTITIQEGAPPGLLLLFIQAYDPDGDNIVFNLGLYQDSVQIEILFFFTVQCVDQKPAYEKLFLFFF